MACFYDNGELQLNALEILHEYYKDRHQVRNSEIFSSEQLQQSTKDKILKGTINDYKNNTNTTVTEFITKENPNIATLIGMNGKNRLSPEYILEERLVNSIHEKLRSDKAIEIPKLSQIVPEVEKTYESIKDKINEVYQDNVDQIKWIINDILEDIELEEYTKSLGITLHELVNNKIRNRSGAYNDALNKYLNDPDNEPFLNKADKKAWGTAINRVVAQIYDNIMRLGIPISEINIAYNENDKHIFALKGKIDLVVVDSNGDAHIYEIKVSKNSYLLGWDQVKTHTLDWQLALYKQLLGQSINVDNTTLNVIPVVISDISNPESLKFEGIQNRGNQNRDLVRGWMETVANQIIPKKILGEYDPNKLSGFKDSLYKLFGEDYSVKLSSKENSVEGLIKEVEARYAKYGGKYKFFNNFRDIEGMKTGYVEAETLEELMPKIEQYINHKNNNKDKIVIDLKESLKHAIINRQKISTGNENYDLKLNRILVEYVSDSWEVVEEFPEVTELGLVVLRNRDTGQINIISLSSNVFLANSNIEGFTEGDIEYAKVFLFMNAYKDILLPYSSNKFGEVIIFNPENGKTYYRTTHQQFKKFYDLMKSKGFEDGEINISIENNFLGIVNIAMQSLDNFYRSFRNELSDDGIGAIINPLFEESEITIKRLLEAQKELFTLFPGHKLKTFESGINFEDNTEVAVALLNSAILYALKDDIDSDYHNISDFSMNVSDFRSLFSALFTENNPNYDSQGRRITGIFQGLKWTTPDWVPSKILRSFNKLLSGANSRIAELMLKESQRINKLTLQYYKDINFSETERFWVGATQNKYKNLWIQDGNEVAPEFVTKNPYAEDVANALTDVERSYLKHILFRINIYKLGIDENLVKNLDPESLSSIRSNTTIAEAIDDGKYFEMPLVRREERSRHKELFRTTGEKFIDKLKGYRHEAIDFLDNRGLTNNDIKALEDARLGFYEMYDTYSRHSPEFKARMIQEHGINYFEFNLDTIAHRLIFNKIRKHIFDQVFPVTNAYAWWLKFDAAKTNDKIENHLKYMYDQIKLAAYGEHIIDPEFKDLSIGQAMMKRISTFAMLAFRPILMAKELTIGTFKNITLAATQMYGKDVFTLKDLTKAYGKMLTIDKRFTQEFNLINRLNHLYRFSNMDAGTIAMKTQTDRHGVLMRGLGRYMYASNTVPDDYNRVVLFVAKMLHEGSYDAHYMENDELMYDPTKDKRFEYYFSEREKYRKSKTEFGVASNDTKYNEQRRKYLFLINELNKDSALFGKKLTENDLANKAYPDIERDSFKSFTDMAYGYYDKDSQQQASNLWWGQTWLQFMQFWPGKMKMWFGKPTEKSGEDSAWGKVNQLTTVTEDGQEVPVWRETYTKEDGSTDVRPTIENTGDPWIHWEGTYFEGLAYSSLHTLRNIATLNFSDIKNNPERNARVLFAIEDAIFMYIMFSLFALMFGTLKKENPDGMSNELMKFGESLSQKVAREQNILDNTFGAIRSTPAWLSWSKRFANDMLEVLEGDKTVKTAAARNFGSLEMFRE